MKDSIYIFALGVMMCAIVGLGFQVEENSNTLRNEINLTRNAREDYMFEIQKIKNDYQKLKEEYMYLRSRMIGYDETFEKLQMEELADKIDKYIQDGINAGALVN